MAVCDSLIWVASVASSACCCLVESGGGVVFSVGGYSAVWVGGVADRDVLVWIVGDEDRGFLYGSIRFAEDSLRCREFFGF
jgi:hypothetical protein